MDYNNDMISDVESQKCDFNSLETCENPYNIRRRNTKDEERKKTTNVNGEQLHDTEISNVQKISD